MAAPASTWNEPAPATENADVGSDPIRTRFGRKVRWCAVNSGQHVQLATHTHRLHARLIDIMALGVIYYLVDTLSLRYCTIIHKNSVSIYVL